MSMADALNPFYEARDLSMCPCDFCTGKKKFDDNWCVRCGEVKMLPPKRWENMDMCDECEIAFEKECNEVPKP